MEAAQTETLEYCGDRKSQKGDGRSGTVHEKIVFDEAKILSSEVLPVSTPSLKMLVIEFQQQQRIQTC